MTDMELKDILAISGQPGLFRYVARSSNGVIVESLADGRRMNSSGTAKISALAEIAIYTETEELPLWQVFEKFYAYTDGKPTIDAKSDAVLLKKTFGEVVPDYDRDRVHVSDMKKVVSWFNLLVGAGMTDFRLEKEDGTETDGEKDEAAAEYRTSGVERAGQKPFRNGFAVRGPEPAHSFYGTLRAGRPGHAVAGCL